MDLNQFLSEFNRLSNEFGVTHFKINLGITKRRDPNSYWGLDFLLIKGTENKQDSLTKTFDQPLFKMYEADVSKEKVEDFLRLLDECNKKTWQAKEISNAFMQSNQVEWNGISFHITKFTLEKPNFISFGKTHYHLALQAQMKITELVNLRSDTCHYDNQLQVINSFSDMKFNGGDIPWYAIEIYPNKSKMYTIRLGKLGIIFVRKRKEKGLKLKYQQANQSKVKGARLINFIWNLLSKSPITLLNNKNMEIDAYVRYRNPYEFFVPRERNWRENIKISLQTIPILLAAVALLVNKNPDYSLPIAITLIGLSILINLIIFITKS